jgi:mono/diheme cytochrome c family protein
MDSRPLSVLVLALLATGCAQRAPTVQPPRSQDANPAAAKTYVHGVAKQYCGSCHQASLPTAKPAALAIYNLDASGDWAATLSAAQLEGGFTRRLAGRLDDDGRRALAAFVAHEVAQRAKR